MRRMTFATMLTALLVMTMGIGAVMAAPVKNPHAETFVLDCEGEELEIVVARGNPAHVVGSNQRLIPHEFTFELWINEVRVFEETEGVGQGNKNGLKHRLVECELEFELTAEDFTEEDIEFLADLGIDLDEADEIIGRLLVKVMKTPAR